jgi:Ca2+/Na+ antiporter
LDKTSESSLAHEPLGNFQKSFDNHIYSMAIAYSPVVAAVLFVLTTILRLTWYGMHVQREESEHAARRDLNPEQLRREWKFRQDTRLLVGSANLFNAAAWLLFAIPIMQMAWVLSRRGKRNVTLHCTIVFFALAGIITEVISRLLVFGRSSSATWISSSFNMGVWLPDDISNEPDDMGWKALEISFTVFHGLLSFIDSFEWFCLFIILVCTAYSVVTMQDRVFNIWWARFGLLVAVLSIFDLAAGIVLFTDNHKFIRAAIGISAVNMIFFLPAWLIMLAIQLPKALPNYDPGLDFELTQA